jgi:hypothetical protein
LKTPGFGLEFLRAGIRGAAEAGASSLIRKFQIPVVYLGKIVATLRQ